MPRRQTPALRHVVKGAAPAEERSRVLSDFLTARATGQAAHMAAAHRTVAELAEHARRLGVTIGLETRLHCHEIPNPGEVCALIDGYPPEVVGYWHDVGHAEVQDRLGVVPSVAGSMSWATAASAPTCTTSTASSITAPPARHRRLGVHRQQAAR